MKTLQVVEQAFRTLVEEQDDTILWLTQCMLGAGGDMELLLNGNCAYYAVSQQRQPALKLGKWQQTEPADLTRDLDNLHAKGVPVYVLKEDLAERGLADTPVHAGVQVIDRSQLVALYERVDQIWQW
jgi:sulfur relay (sulfurtransferase) DsrF/TusC family protein